MRALVRLVIMHLSEVLQMFVILMVWGLSTEEKWNNWLFKKKEMSVEFLRAGHLWGCVVCLNDDN